MAKNKIKIFMFSFSVLIKINKIAEATKRVCGEFSVFFAKTKNVIFERMNINKRSRGSIFEPDLSGVGAFIHIFEIHSRVHLQ
jgi:hypothetical protein